MAVIWVGASSRWRETGRSTWNKNKFLESKQTKPWLNLQGAPQTFVELVCRCSSSSRRWCELGQKTDFTSTFLAAPIQVEAKVIAPSQTFESKKMGTMRTSLCNCRDWLTETINKRCRWNFGDDTKNEGNEDWSLHTDDRLWSWGFIFINCMIFISHSKSWRSGVVMKLVNSAPVMMSPKRVTVSWEAGARWKNAVLTGRNENIAADIAHFQRTSDGGLTSRRKGCKWLRRSWDASPGPHV